LKKYASKWEPSPKYGWKKNIFETTIFYNNLLQPPDIFLEPTSGSTDPVALTLLKCRRWASASYSGAADGRLRNYVGKKQLTSPSLTARPWKMMVGRQLSYWEGNFSLAMLNFGRVYSGECTWRIIPISKLLVVMVIVRPLSGVVGLLSKWHFHGLYIGIINYTY